MQDDELDEETKSYLNSTSVQDEDAILSSPKGSTSSKSPEHQTETNSGAASDAQPKKVVLKRKLITSVSLTENEPSKNTITGPTSTESKVLKLSDSTTASTGEKASESNDSNGNTDGTVVKLTQLSMKERLELRAKKFGAPVSGDVAKLARAERFGIPEAKATASASGGGSSGGGSSSGGAAISTAKTAADVDLLKKRAERFGGSVSNTMVKIEMNEKLLKRQERFGAGAASGGGATTTTTTVTGKVEAKPVSTQAASDYAEKAKLRLERFKTTA